MNKYLIHKHFIAKKKIRNNLIHVKKYEMQQFSREYPNICFVYDSCQHKTLIWRKNTFYYFQAKRRKVSEFPLFFVASRYDEKSRKLYNKKAKVSQVSRMKFMVNFLLSKCIQHKCGLKTGNQIIIFFLFSS